MRRKKSPLSKAKEALEVVQKALVILKYGNDCYTCPQRALEGSNCHLGHVPWPRAHLSVQCIYTVDYTRIQCYSCNINKGGMGAVALERMKSEGIDTDALLKVSNQTKGKPIPLSWFTQKREEYQRECDKLLLWNQKNLSRLSGPTSKKPTSTAR